MTWENYGVYKVNEDRKWNIEHIIPQSLFDFSNKDEIKRCWDLLNIVPKDSLENIKKGNKING